MTERSPPNAGDRKSASRTKINMMDQLPTPPVSNNAPSDFSDAPSVDPQHPTSQKRRNKRGGRKANKKAQRLQSVSEFDIPQGKDLEHDSISEPKYRDGDSHEGSHSDSISETSDARKLREVRSSRPSGNRKPKADTGIKAFNLKRAESSGGGPPIEVTVERLRAKGKAKNATREKLSEERSDEEEETEQTKCLSIRFDLNLEVEIFLKAKIKGDVTMTFLE